MTRLPSVRYAKVPKAWNVRPQPVKAVWKPFVPASFASDKLTLSAVAFYYACELHHALGVPVGIVDASWGGTGIDAWTPRCGYEGCDPSLKAFAEYPVRADWTKEGETLAAINGPHQQPTVIWNAMVDVWTPMAMRGFIWYQGCHDSGDADLYAAKMHALYDGWSKAFANPALKLYFVQLAPYSTSWMKLAAAQNRFAAEEPNAALAVTADVGNFDDIHPNRKEIVAKRLAVHALKRDYGFDIPEDDSPTFRRAVAEGAEAVLTFDHVRNWYVYDEDSTMDPPFELAGDDGVWKPARIRNKTNRKKWFGGVVTGVELRLAADGVDAPTRVRYMGRDRTKGTLFNEASLPLGPFEAVVQKETK